MCFLTYDEEHHRIMIGHNPNATPRDPKAAGVVHFAYAVETLDDLVNAYLRLKAEGIVPHNCINHGFTTSLYYHDPDENEVELQVDNFETRESMDAWFATGAFDRNFVGHPFDPERMVRAPPRRASPTTRSSSRSSTDERRERTARSAHAPKRSTRTSGASTTPSSRARADRAARGA